MENQSASKVALIEEVAVTQIGISDVVAFVPGIMVQSQNGMAAGLCFAKSYLIPMRIDMSFIRKATNTVGGGVKVMALHLR